MINASEQHKYVERKWINGEYLSEEEAFDKHKNLIWVAVNKLLPAARLRGIDEEDLYSIGTIGFIKAYRRFDDTKGYRFSTYVVKSVWGFATRQIHKYFNGPYIDRTLTDLTYKILKMNGLSAEEISKKLDVPKSKVESAMLSLIPALHLEDSSKHVGHGLTYENLLSFDEDFSLIDVREFFETLDEKEKNVLKYRMEGYTQNEISELLGFSQPHVSRVLGRIKTKIFEHFQMQEKM